jgi:GntR family transcriptional regulator
MSVIGKMSKSRQSIAVDANLPTPLYHQIYNILRGKIFEREYIDGEQFLSEKEVAQAYEVSRITARRALDELANDGLVIRERGRGTKVTYNAPSRPLHASVEGMLENILAMGLETEVSLLEFEYIAPNEQVMEALECSATDLVQHSIRVRRIDKLPFSYLTTYVPEFVGRTFGSDDLGSTSLLSLLERSGVEVTRAEQIISSTPASPQVARALEVELSSPLLRIRRIVYDQADRPVEFITSLYRPDRYEYRMQLSRVRSTKYNTWSQSDSS